MQHTHASIAIVDDQILLRNGLNNPIRGLETYAILFEAKQGPHFVKQIPPRYVSNLLQTELNRQEANGHETALWLKRDYPDVRIVALVLHGDDSAVIRMLKNDVRAYIFKDMEPAEFRLLLKTLMRKRFYYSELITGTLIHPETSLDQAEQPVKNIILNDRELEFIKLACTEMTYKEIADRMYLSVRTIDGYRDALFEKLDVKSRVGLVIYAIKHGVVAL